MQLCKYVHHNTLFRFFWYIQNRWIKMRNWVRKLIYNNKIYMYIFNQRHFRTYFPKIFHNVCFKHVDLCDQISSLHRNCTQNILRFYVRRCWSEQQDSKIGFKTSPDLNTCSLKISSAHTTVHTGKVCYGHP